MLTYTDCLPAAQEAVKIIARIEFMERQGERKWLAAISAQKRALCHHIKCIKNHQSQSLNIVWYPQASEGLDP